MTRTQARELLMQLLFQMEAQKDFSIAMKNKYMDEHFSEGKQQGYARKLISTVLEHLEEIDAALDRSSKTRNTKRMAKVDLAIARLALGEALYMDNIPDGVAINEAVNMARKYSTEDSRRFINGILGNIINHRDES